jgi:hypothetical protein
VYFALPNGPGHCPLLNERDNAIVAHRAVIARGEDIEDTNKRQIFWKQAVGFFITELSLMY